MENVRTNFKKLGKATKILSIIGVIIGGVMSVIGFMFNTLLKDVFNNAEDLGPLGVVLIIFLVIFMALALLWYFGLVLLIVSVVFLIVSIKLKEYSEYNNMTLKEKRKSIVLLTIPYVVCAALLIIITILCLIAELVSATLIFIIPIILMVNGMNTMFTSLRCINEYKEESKLCLKQEDLL